MVSQWQKRAVAVTADVGDLGRIDTMVKQASASPGQIDILNNNPGVTRSTYIMT
jgi:NADP-dependent 3-hydroxy acid dehydrogenase YdfG